MPFFEEAASSAYVPPHHEVAGRWAAKVNGLDGFIFVTAKYSRGLTAVLTNALDYAYREFNRGAARAIEQLRLIDVELQMAPTRSGVHIGGADFVGLWRGGKTFEELPHLTQSAQVMLDELAWWTKALKTARDGTVGEQDGSEGRLTGLVNARNFIENAGGLVELSRILKVWEG
jgi:NAD(P)H-dependent FMN reductase